MATADSRHLRPMLDGARATLKDALGEACDADLDRANTGELIRIEEVLSIASEAAKNAISIRRRLRTDSESGTSTESGASTSRVSRELEDGATRWAVFSVHPTVSDGRPTVRPHLRDGWLSFDSGAETRRIAPIPEGWQLMSDDELRTLCQNAEVAPRRSSAGKPGGGEIAL